MERAITITTMLLLALTVSCRKVDNTAAKTDPTDQDLEKLLVGTWVYEHKLSQMRTTYQSSGTWRMQSYPTDGVDEWKSEIKHRLRGVVGKPMTTYHFGLRVEGTWRIDSGRLLLTEEDCPDSEEDIRGLTETHWTRPRGNAREVSVRLNHWDSMTDEEILAYHGTLTAALADPYEGMGYANIKDKARQSYLMARAYMVYDDNAKARDLFASMIKSFPDNKYAKPSQLYLHICQAKLAVDACDWPGAQSEYYRAYLLAIKFHRKSLRDSTFHSWANAIRGYIRTLDSVRVMREEQE